MTLLLRKAFVLLALTNFAGYSFAADASQPGSGTQVVKSCCADCGCCSGETCSCEKCECCGEQGCSSSEGGCASGCCETGCECCGKDESKN